MLEKARHCLILTDGGFGVGLGHVTRCLALADALLESGWTVDFEVNGDRDVCTAFLKDYPSTSLKIETEAWTRGSYAKLDEHFPLDAIVFDSYLPSLAYYEGLIEHANYKWGKVVFLFFDDTNRIDYPQGIVVNGAASAATLGYHMNAEVRYLLGTEWQVLRKPFWDAKPIVVRPNAQELLIMLGADDVHGMLPRLHIQAKQKFPQITQTIITTEFSRTYGQLLKIVSAPHRLLVEPSAVDFIQAIQRSDIAISAAGQSVFELSLLGVPAVLLQVAENQSGNMQAWKSQGMATTMHRWDHQEVVGSILNDVETMMPFPARMERHTRACKLIDAGGAKRIASQIEGMIGEENC